MDKIILDKESTRVLNKCQKGLELTNKDKKKLHRVRRVINKKEQTRQRNKEYEKIVEKLFF